MKYPLVTAFTFIYNTNPEYIIQAIKSFQRNNYPNIEHIIIDDCSPDQNPSIAVEKWIKENNYECKFIRNPVNQGVSQNLNDIIAMARGKYLVGCCDDVLADDRIIGDVELLEGLPDDYAVVFGFSQEIDSEGKLLPIISPNPPTVKDDNYFEELVKGNFISGPTVTMRTEALKAVGGYDKSLIVDDYYMWMRLSYTGYKFKMRPAITAYYRVHGQGLSYNPRLNLDVLKIRSKYPDRIPLKSMFDQEIRALLKQHETKKADEVIALYEESFRSYAFAKWLRIVRISGLRSALLFLKQKIGGVMLAFKS